MQHNNVNFEELIDSNDLIVAKAFKESIKEYFQTLKENFETDLGREFLYRHTRKLDEYIAQMYRFVLRRSFGDFIPMQSSIPIVLVALGSYGRQQLAVYSDIDIMILYKDVDGYNIKPIIERFVMTAWDAGLKLGHRVHEIKEIVDVSQTDHTIKTALLESRFLTGSKFLYIEYQNVLRVVRAKNQKQFFEEKLAEARSRAAKYPVSMEPNIKECAGGLRSGNTLFWLATSLYGVSSNKQLVDKLYSDAEYKEYIQSMEFLFRVRIALHLEAGKKQDTLIMQYQRAIALKLGFKDSASKGAEYALVARTIKSMYQINLFCQTYIQKLARKVFYGDNSFAQIKSFKQKNDFYINKNKCVAVRFSRQEVSLQGALILLANIKDFNAIDSSVVYWLKRASNNGVFDCVFWLAFLSSQKSHLILKALYDAGRFSDVLPQFEGITHLAQFDGYHAFPVDIHTIACVKAIEESLNDGYVYEVWSAFSGYEKAFLKLLLIFHDIGKGRAQNHSILGSKMFGTFAKKAGFDSKEIEIGKLIILRHTLMSDTALREDLNSEKTIINFASRLQSERALKLLYILTCADMSGVASNVYTFVNASLVKELYIKALDKLGNKRLLFEASARLQKESQLVKSTEFLALDRQTQRAIKSIKSDQIFLQYDAKQIIELAKIIKSMTNYSFSIKNSQVLEIDIISKKPVNIGWLFSKLSFLDIASMDVFKLFDGAKMFRVYFREVLSEESDITKIEQWIEASFDMSRVPDYKNPSIEKKGLTLDCNHSQDYAKLQLNAKNQQGLLAFVIGVFDEFGIDIATAKISTIKQSVRDMFIIEKSSGICENKTKVFKRLCEFAKGEKVEL